MQEWIEIRDGRRYRVTLISDAPAPARSRRKRRRPKEQDGDMTRFHLTKFPFAATVNGRPVTVWPDWIEEEDQTNGLL